MISDCPEAEHVCQIAHFAGAQADARSGGAIIWMSQGEQDMPDSMGPIPGHLPDVTNTQALARAADRSSICSSRPRQQLKSLGLTQL